MAPGIEDERPPTVPPIAAVQGSGELELEVAITRMRGSIMRLVTELDRFSDTVRVAREQVARIAGEAEALKAQLEPKD